MGGYGLKDIYFVVSIIKLKISITWVGIILNGKFTLKRRLCSREEYKIDIS